MGTGEQTPEDRVVRQAGRRARLDEAMARDGKVCVWCRTPFDDRWAKPTTEHLVPRIKGGPSWLENEMAACQRCNKDRGHQSISVWVEECRARGWEPRTDEIHARLLALQAIIARRGGQRRARRYIDGQLRRLEKHRETASD